MRVVLTLQKSSIAIFGGLFQLSNHDLYFYYFILNIFDDIFHVSNLKTSLTEIDIIRWLIKTNQEVKGLPMLGFKPWTSQFLGSCQNMFSTSCNIKFRLEPKVSKAHFDDNLEIAMLLWSNLFAKMLTPLAKIVPSQKVQMLVLLWPGHPSSTIFKSTFLY